MTTTTESVYKRILMRFELYLHVLLQYATKFKYSRVFYALIVLELYIIAF